MTTSIIVPQATKKRTAGRKRRRAVSIYKWLRDRISSVDFGIKYQGHPIHCNGNDEVLSAFKHVQWLDRLTNGDFDDHFSGKHTFYFTANGSTKARECLVLIDIDCHKNGSLQGAVAFAEHLREEHFPSLYYEVSTNGNGVHAYVIVEKGELAAEFLLPLLKRLDRHLKRILSDAKCDVEDVEIKGTPPVFVWGNQRGDLTNYKSGQLGKLPRDKHRFDELQKTSRLTYFDLLKLPPVEHSEPRDTTNPRKPSPQVRTGSLTGKVIADEELGRLDGHYCHVAKTLLETHALTTTGRAVATIEDVAIFLMLLRFFTENMNQDNSLPQARFKGLWSALYASGDIRRPFDDKRFAAIRNYLSSLGLLDWQDEHYRLGWTGSDGVYHRGQACCWKASELLMGLLDWSKWNQEKTEDNQQKPIESDTVRKGEGEEAPFTGTTILEAVQSVIRCPDNQTTRPVLAMETEQWRISPEEIGVYIATFEDQLSLAA